MGVLFWFRRFVMVFGIAFVVIVSAHLLRGHELIFSFSQSLLWTVISAIIFTVSRIYQSRKGVHCVLCNDIPDAQKD